ncbi:MAG: GDSL-type esterase/lipase family protein, partial [Opitutales bacterium]
GDWIHCIDCVVRNNLVTRCHETGILACHTKNCLITHNTVHDPKAPHKRLLFVQFANKGLTVANNLLSGPPPNVTTKDSVSFRDNVVASNLEALFINPLAGDLRLAKPDPRIIDSCHRQVHVSHDFSHQPRLDQPDAGADEFNVPNPRRASADGFVTTTTPKSVVPKKPKPATKTVTALEPAWVDPMREIHAKFTGKAGRIAQFGDSITYSMAFWSPLGWSAPDAYLPENDGLPKKPKDKRWRDWIIGTRDKGPKFGNYSGWRVGNVLKAIDEVLRRDQPEVAIVMLGTNDISGNKVPASYEAGFEQIVEKCLATGCVPVLNTIPPRRNHDDAVKAANAIIRKVAARRKVPLADFHAAILERRPGDSWDGTLISKDGVHPSGGKSQDYSPENLKTCGYALRNWVNFLAVREVYFRILHPEKKR